MITAILDGTQPATLTRDNVFKANLPLDWSLQRRIFGVPAPWRVLPQRCLSGRGMWPVEAEEEASPEKPSSRSLMRRRHFESDRLHAREKEFNPPRLGL